MIDERTISFKDTIFGDQEMSSESETLRYLQLLTQSEGVIYKEERQDKKKGGSGGESPNKQMSETKEKKERI
jgi:hypothetical protein